MLRDTQIGDREFLASSVCVFGLHNGVPVLDTNTPNELCKVFACNRFLIHDFALFAIAAERQNTAVFVRRFTFGKYNPIGVLFAPITDRNKVGKNGLDKLCIITFSVENEFTRLFCYGLLLRNA